MFDVSVNVRVYDFCLLMCHVWNVNIKLVNKLQSFCRLHLLTLYNVFTYHGCKWSSGYSVGLVTFRSRVRILPPAICKQP